MHRKKRPYIGFIAPGFILYSLFIIVPILFAALISLHEWSGLGKMEFVGLDNFKLLFTSPKLSKTFFHALLNNVKYVLANWFFITPVQFLLAYLLFIKIPGHKYFRFMIFLPYVISSTIVSFFSTIVFDPNIGVLNNILEFLHLPKGSWFGDPDLSFLLLVFIMMWQGIGTGMMIFYANMQEISESIIEAGKIDGCGEWAGMVRIVIPLTVPSIATNMILSTIYALGIFDIPYILAGPTGGAAGSLDFANLVFYRYTFGSALNGKTNLGFGAAISVVMFLIIFTISMLQNKFASKVEYDNQG